MNKTLKEPHAALFWSIPHEELLHQLQTSPDGLTVNEAEQRLRRFGPNILRPKKRTDALTLFVSQFKSPIILILLFAAGLSSFLHDPVDALIILSIVFISGILGFWQERGATITVERLLNIVEITSTTMRDRAPKETPVEEIVPGDIVLLKAGDIVPGDCRILEAKDCFVDEAALTGEPYPIEKTIKVIPSETAIAQRENTLFMGTHVVSGTARALVVITGIDTEFGKVSERLKLRHPETEFEHGVRRFGYLLMEVTLLLVIAIFAVNVYLKRPVLDSFLFALALAVGLTPQLLPAIVSINLAHGAKRMAQEKTIVKRLASIENFGSMNVLCSDKTGTITEGTAQVHSSIDIEGGKSEEVFLHAYLNAVYQTGFKNPIDEAILAHRRVDTSSYKKLDEVPYDFIRKRLSILVAKNNRSFMITKGAVANVLAACESAKAPDGTIIALSTVKDQIQHYFDGFSNKGFRVLGIAYKDVDSGLAVSKGDETGMVFLGFILLADPLKAGIGDTLKCLNDLGVSFKIITGDNRLAAANVSQQLGIPEPHMLTGAELHLMSDEALLSRVNDIDIFAEVEPNQKERIILSLRKTGNVVGYMGDGINDAPALHAADVGISVDSAVDVAKEAADIVLLEKNLKVLSQGVQEGRKTFSNTLKYVFMATSANFGNMFSMAGASLFLPFLPLLPKQILLTNLMTDFPEMTIATDSVDRELVERPRRWDIGFIRKFMITFGILSSVFDYLTFGALLFILNATTDQFRTGWFMESVVSASLIVLVIRSRRPFFRSMPGMYLFMTTLLVVVFTLVFPYTPLSRFFAMQPLPISFLFMLGVIVLLYIVAAEIVKKIFYKRTKF